MTRLLPLLGLISLLLAAGCRKDDVVDCVPVTPPVTPPTSNLTLAEFTRRNGVPVQTFSLALGPMATVQTFTTSGGARIAFPTPDFLLPGGAAATGIAEVRVREIYSVPDMVLSNMPTQTGGSRRLLISGGEFSIQVWQNGTRLRLVPGLARIGVQSPPVTAASTGPLRPVLWQQPAARLLGDSAGWVRPANRTDSVRTSSVYSVDIPLDSVSWWNIDRLWHLYQSAPLGTVTVQTPAIPAASTGATRVFVRLVGSNGLARLYPDAAQTSWTGQLPTGASLVAVVLQSVNGQLYFGAQAFTTQNGVVLSPALTAVSEADAVRLIKQL